MIEQLQKQHDRKNERNEARMQGHLFEHFGSEDRSGFLGNVSMALIDKKNSKNPKKRGDY